jgi:hypothetical protein
MAKAVECVNKASGSASFKQVGLACKRVFRGSGFPSAIIEVESLSHNSDLRFET